MNSKREIIYVDAGGTSNEYKISLYHMNNDKVHIMELIDIANNNQAEKYAIYNAIFYIVRNNYNNCIILSDNQTAITDKVLLALSKDLNIQIAWIPREINQIADENCKLPPTLDSYEFNTLNLFIKLSKMAYMEEAVEDNIEELKKLREANEKLKVRIKNQTTHLNILNEKLKANNGKSK